MRGAAETRIQVLEVELKDASIRLRKTEADLNEARAKIRTAIADFKKSVAFENYIDSRRQQWLSDFHQSPGFQVEMWEATLAGANKVLEKLDALHPDWKVFDEVKRPRR